MLKSWSRIRNLGF